MVTPPAEGDTPSVHWQFLLLPLDLASYEYLTLRLPLRLDVSC